MPKKKSYILPKPALIRTNARRIQEASRRRSNSLPGSTAENQIIHGPSLGNQRFSIGIAKIAAVVICKLQFLYFALQTDLGGRHLKVAGDIWNPWFTIDKSGAPRGVAFEIFRTISVMLNFTYSIEPSRDGTWGISFPNGTVTGMLGMVHRKEVDMGIGPFMVSDIRLPLVEFSTPIYSDYYSLLLPRPKSTRDFGNFLRPFASEVWFGLLVCVLVSTTFGIAVEFFMSRKKILDKNPNEAYFFRAFSILQALTAEVVNVKILLKSGKLFLATWLILGSIVPNAYSGVLVSLLAVPKINIPIDSLQDLVNYGRMKWAVEYNTQQHHFFLGEKNGHNRVNRIFGEKMETIHSCIRNKWEIIAEGKAFVCDITQMKQIMDEEFSKNATCSYYIAKNPIYLALLSFIFPKNSSLVPLFDIWIKKFRESGIIEKSLSEATSNATACLQRPGSEDKITAVVFNLEDLGGTFFILLAGAFVALLVLLIENCHISGKREKIA